MAYNGPLPLKVAASGTGRSSNSAYGVLCAGSTAAGNLQQMSGLGLAGQVISSLGPGKLPIWSNPPLVLIQSQTVSGVTSLTFTSGIAQPFNNYILLMTNVIQATGSTPLMARISTNGGSTYLNTGYTTGDITFDYNSSTPSNGNFTSGLMACTQAGAGLIRNGILYLYNLTSGVKYITSQSIQTQFTVTGNPRMELLTGSYNTANNVVNALQIVTQNGAVNISGTFTLYGLFE